MSRTFQLPGVALLLLLPAAVDLAPAGMHAADTVSLAGEWRFGLDRKDVGVGERWFAEELPDKIRMPGILQAQGYGDEIGVHTPWVLTLYDRFWYLRADYSAYTNAGDVQVPFLCQPPRHYLGVAWYQREIEIPEGWRDQRVVLFLERPHWKTTAWCDDREAGSDLSLCAPHEHPLGRLSPGKHRLTIRVDNRMILPYRPDAHSVSDSLDAAWNGIVGRIELRASDPVCIERLRLDPDLEQRGVRVTLYTHNGTGRALKAPLVLLQVVPENFGGTAFKPLQGSAVIEPGDTNLTLFFPMGDHFQHWSEFNPRYYNLRATIGGAGFHSETADTFGMREIKVVGNQFVLNGRPIYLRGTHDGGDFPVTGYPPTDAAAWRRIFQTCKDYGLNHVRFHSWCPPEAAFQAADETGIYLQVECGMWNSFTPGGEMVQVLYAETERILRAYGNHPSFLLLSASNEAHGRWKQCLPQWVEHFRTEDSRRLYTPDTGWSPIDSPGPVTGADYLDVGRIGPLRVRGQSGWFGRDFRRSVAGVNVPVVAHEVGQWCAYPDYRIIKKFTGFMQPGNYEIFRDSARAHGLFAAKEQDAASPAGRAGTPRPAARMDPDDRARGAGHPVNEDFARASGRFQLECYKEEVEANLRTPGLDGFQLLDLHDYVGQGTALVGLLDTFWDSKGYVTPREFREFCNTVVPLARLPGRVFTTADPFEVDAEIANFGASPLANVTPTWRIEDLSGTTIARGEWPARTIVIGKNLELGKISADLSPLPAPRPYRLIVSVEPAAGESAGRSEAPPGSEALAGRQAARRIYENSWNFWLYPARVSDAAPPGVLVTGSWDAAAAKLTAGGNVLFLPRPADLDWTSPPLDSVPIFWNRLMNPDWSRMLGLWCETNHPALAEFPTGPNCDWQWTEILRHTRAVNLDRLPRGLQPIVQAIDDWNRNWKLGLVFDCKVGAGKLVFCTIDLEHDLDRRPVARQLRRSLLDYMAGPGFRPRTTLSVAEFRSLFFDTRIMRKLAATALADGRDAGAAIDGDPGTCWFGGESHRGPNPAPYPHELTVTFPAPVPMNGVVLLSRQNDRDHLGDTCAYRIEAANGGGPWREIAEGTLASTWDPQTIRFGKTVTATRLKFSARSGFGNDRSTALAELAVLYAGPELAVTNAGTIKYGHAPGTSGDVDEGGNGAARPDASR